MVMEREQIHLFIFVLLIHHFVPHECVLAPAVCPTECTCFERRCDDAGSDLCNGLWGYWNDVKCFNFSADLLSGIPREVNSYTVLAPINDSELSKIFSEDLPNLKTLSVSLLGNVHLEKYQTKGQEALSHLNLSNGALRSFPNFVESILSLETLNLSSNAITGKVDLSLSFSNLKTIDLSENVISEFSLTGELPNLDTVLLNGNMLSVLPKLTNFTQLQILDLSNNYFVMDGTLFNGEKNLSVSKENCKRTLPRSTRTLYFRGNSLWKIPNKNCGLLAGLDRLELLSFEDNSILTVSDEEFPDEIYTSLLYLLLDHNKIYSLSPNSMDKFTKLRLLSLSNNNIRHISPRIFEHVSKQLIQEQDKMQAGLVLAIRAENNRLSCDCTQQEMLSLFKHEKNISSVIGKDDYVCSYPHWLHGMRLFDLTDTELQCFEVVLQRPKNVTCDEYDDCQVSCAFDGLPYPTTHWVSPQGVEISAESLASDSSLRSSYSLSSDGQQLTILNLQYHKTGIYRCIANSSQGSKAGKVQVGVILAPVGSIVAIVVSAVSFLVAITLNTVNLFHYYCQHLENKRAMREAENMSFKMESPLKSKMSGLHESEASLNANKYYRKYDFTCQQVFLDTVIKGAHTVKRTLYDAKHSEFSNNIWEYASHLRDRLHIELPSSVQFPRVSMPSISMPTISMPNISMPSMPNFQSINTNIERLGTSVMNRSHNLATSVGSVFTLRWLRSGNSDNDSDSDLEQAGFSEVQVHVHKDSDETSSQELLTTDDSAPGTSQKTDLAGTSKVHFLRKTVATSHGKEQFPRRTKSVRFSEDNRPTIVKEIRRSASFTTLSNICDETDFVATAKSSTDQKRSSVNVVCVSIPESYQYETTV